MILKVNFRHLTSQTRETEKEVNNRNKSNIDTDIVVEKVGNTRMQHMHSFS